MKKDSSNLEGLQEEIVKLLVLLVSKDEIQKDLILKLASLGFGTSRIAELLGTTPNTVNVTIQKSKRRRGKKKK
jgi:DNA-binding NarL/FixJ family response regulator